MNDILSVSVFLCNDYVLQYCYSFGPAYHILYNSDVSYAVGLTGSISKNLRRLLFKDLRAVKQLDWPGS